MAESKRGVIITGPESVGKTTLAKCISDVFGGNYVEEYAREYINSLNREYNYSDIEKIAAHQLLDFEHYNQKHPSELNVFDTYLIITKIWFLWNANLYPLWIDAKIAETNEFLYLLCEPDIEWKKDSVRENGGEKRWRLFNEYKTELDRFGLNYKTIRGKGNVRSDTAISFVQEYLDSN